MGEVPSPSRELARVSIVLGDEDQLAVSVSEDHGPLSAALVELKGQCMKFLGDHLLRQNTPLEDPHEVLGLDAASDGEEEKAEIRSVPIKKKRT